MEKDNITQILTKLVEELGIQVTRQTIANELQKHPEYGSLLAYSDVLNNLQVPNAAYRLTFEQLIDVPLPYIAFASQGKFILVTALDKNHAVVSNEYSDNVKLTIEQFNQLYSGLVLLAEKKESSGEVDYIQKRRKEVIDNLRFPVFFIGSFILLIAYLVLHSSYFNSFNRYVALLTLFKTSGLIVSVLLLLQSFNSNNSFMQKLCHSGGNIDCNAILSSNAAKVTEGLSWSELGFFYFAGTWFTILFNSDNVHLMQALSIINVLSLPYTFYSIYYQWRIEKRWCILCCTIQAILWFEFFSFLPYVLQGLQVILPTDLFNLIVGLSIPILIWMWVKPYLLNAKQLKSTQKQLTRFKYNIELFNKLLNDEVKYVPPKDEYALVLANRDAEQVITIVSNPYCQPCQKMHKALDDWLTKRTDVKLQVIFSTQNSQDDKRIEVAAHLLSLQNDSSLKNALNDWYSQKQKNYQSWAKRYPEKENSDNSKILEMQRQWCTMAEISHTPTLFINGRKLPKNYEVDDIKYFI